MRARLLSVPLMLASIMLLVCGGTAQAASQQKPPAENVFTDQDASALLRQLSEALEGHSQKKLLALFDLSQMKDSALFKQQINLFFSQAESIRVHLNLIETNAENERPTFAVDAEMEVEPTNGGPVVRQNERLTFTVARVGNGWKFIEAQPRSFFSLP